MSKNPPWSRDELILALDLYLRHPESTPGHNSLEVTSLSRTLNDLGRKLRMNAGEDFRNPNGVYMKLMNFRRFDPAFIERGMKGLTRGNKEEGAVWEEFAGNPVLLAKVATAIRSALNGGPDDDLQVELEEEEPGQAEAQEGRLLTRLHRIRERSRSIVQRRKEQAMRQAGKLVCEACGFDFLAVYGERGRGFIECHHTKPVHAIASGEKTRLEDLALLCANCHRMIHAARPWLEVDQLKEMVGRGRG